jgi:hypothetical protein
VDAAQAQEAEDDAVEAEAEAEAEEAALRHVCAGGKKGGEMRWQGERGDAEACGSARRRAVATEATETAREGERARRVAAPDGEPAVVTTAESPTRGRRRQRGGRDRRLGTKTHENQHRANKNKQRCTWLVHGNDLVKIS